MADEVHIRILGIADDTVYYVDAAVAARIEADWRATRGSGHGERIERYPARYVAPNSSPWGSSSQTIDLVLALNAVAGLVIQRQAFVPPSDVGMDTT